MVSVWSPHELYTDGLPSGKQTNLFCFGETRSWCMGICSPKDNNKHDEVPEKDDDPSAVAALTPLSSDSSDSTQESGVLEDQELQVQNAIAAAANPPKESNSISSSNNVSAAALVFASLDISCPSLPVIYIRN